MGRAVLSKSHLSNKIHTCQTRHIHGGEWSRIGPAKDGARETFCLRSWCVSDCSAFAISPLVLMCLPIAPP